MPPWKKYQNQGKPWEKYSAEISSEQGNPAATKARLDAEWKASPDYVPEWAIKNPNLAGLFAGTFGTPTETPIKTAISRTVRPFTEMGGMAAGGIVGVPTGPLGILAGESSGYAGGKGIADLLDQAMGLKQPLSLGGQTIQTGKDLITGGAYSMGGQALGPAIGVVAKQTGKVVKPILGALSGKGTESITQAIKSGTSTGLNELNVLKSSTQFDKALRGKITGEEIVDNAKNALSSIKDARGAAYRAKLDQIKLDKTQLTNIKNDLIKETKDVLSKDNFDITPFRTDKGIDFNFDKSTIVEHQNVVKKALTDIVGWKDNTAAGLDVLKKRIGVYVDQVKRGTPAEALLTRLEKNVSSNLKKNVPEYAEMTKGYAEVTTIIKDIESGLMLRKQVMTGRITADQTLTKLTSSLKDNKELRKELVQTLSDKGGQDLLSQIAGHSMKGILPGGLSSAGPVLIGEAALAHYVSPKIWPILIASSPRVQAEFLRVYGKGLSEAMNVSPNVVKSLAYSFNEYKKDKLKGGD